MSISGNRRRRAWKSAVLCLAASAFCLLFFLVYDQFSHGVRSPYMTYLFAWPLLLGFFPSFVFALAPLPEPGLWSRNLYFSGVASLTVSSALRGVFEIAGTSSSYQSYLMTAGAALLAAGAASWPFAWQKKKPGPKHLKN